MNRDGSTVPVSDGDDSEHLKEKKEKKTRIGTNIG